MNEQLTLEEAITNRDATLHLIAGDPSKRPTVLAVHTAIAEYSRTLGPGESFSSNDIRPLLPPWIAPNAVGPAFGALARRGSIRRIGDVPSTDKATHGARVAVYVIGGTHA